MPPKAKQPSVVRYELGGGKEIRLVLGSITDLKGVDGIVLAANTELRWGGGVSGAIFQAAGREKLEREVKKALKGQSQWPVGQALLTPVPASTRSLPTVNNPTQRIRYVVHAVGPDCREPAQRKDYRRLLKNAYANSCRTASRRGLTSLAFPSISTAIFACPLQEASRIAAETLISCLERDVNLRRIIVAVIDRETFDQYKRAFDAHAE